MHVQRMNRRTFLKRVGASTAALTLTGLVRRVEGPRQRPNVLFLSIDDLNDWIGCLGGHPDVKTPHIDKLAARGVLFTNAHCPAPACNPSRTAALTGMRPSTSGVYFNCHYPWRQSPILQHAVTLPQYFGKHGYHTHGGGKIFHKGAADDRQSWHQYDDLKIINRAQSLQKGRQLNGMPDSSGLFDWGPVEVSREEMRDWIVAEWVKTQLHKDHTEPFFLGCGFIRPHLPWYVPQQYFDLYPLETIRLPRVRDSDLDDVPRLGRQFVASLNDHQKITEHKKWQHAVQAYLASISFVDECIGHVIEAFDTSPYRDNTILILWSDHGFHLGEKLHWRKASLWEEATRCVLLMIAPGVTSPGERCPAPVNLIDMYPTLIELCGLPPQPELEGVSLVPLLEQPHKEWKRPTLTTLGRYNHAVRSERWRYIRYADGSEELYDHTTDPHEWINLAGETQYTEVKRQLAQWLPDSPAPGISCSR